MRTGQVLERALFHIDGAYAIPNVRVVGRVCRTNLPSNTAFRGFGGPQARIPPPLSLTHSQTVGLRCLSPNSNCPSLMLFLSYSSALLTNSLQISALSISFTDICPRDLSHYCIPSYSLLVLSFAPTCSSFHLRGLDTSKSDILSFPVDRAS